ncbi:unnamed protein product [Prorocentrum cordatum]|uniref:ANK_REP_REGION domain-containing protein n=1 Tax=Prorocentrum cordatum TaxID=2364126 RepID=A0ABN9VIV0_9DINO|nr:unnamed protein product [Polarella glacialis]
MGGGAGGARCRPQRRPGSRRARSTGPAQPCASWQRTPLMVAARHGQLEVVGHCLGTSCRQPQLDLVDERGDTALMIAAREGHAQVVRALLAAGADPWARNSAGQSAADLARSEPIRADVMRAEAKLEALRRTFLAQAGVADEADGSGGGAGSCPAGSSGEAGGAVALARPGPARAGAALDGECPS